MKKRILVTIDSKTLKSLKTIKKKTGIPISELIRRAVHEFLIRTDPEEWGYKEAEKE